MADKNDKNDRDRDRNEDERTKGASKKKTKTTPKKERQISLRLSAKGARRLARLTEKTEWTVTQVIEEALKFYAAHEGISAEDGVEGGVTSATEDALSPIVAHSEPEAPQAERRLDRNTEKIEKTEIIENDIQPSVPTLTLTETHPTILEGKSKKQPLNRKGKQSDAALSSPRVDSPRVEPTETVAEQAPSLVKLEQETARPARTRTKSRATTAR